MAKIIKDIKLLFEIGQEIKIKDLNLKGRILGIYIGIQGVQYEVRYFWDGSARLLYFNSEEIEQVSDLDKANGLFK